MQNDMTKTESLHKKLAALASEFGVEGHAQLAGFLLSAAHYEARKAGLPPSALGHTLEEACAAVVASSDAPFTRARSPGGTALVIVARGEPYVSQAEVGYSVWCLQAGAGDPTEHLSRVADVLAAQGAPASVVDAVRGGNLSTVMPALVHQVEGLDAALRADLDMPAGNN